MQNFRVWCHNKNEWEKDFMAIGKDGCLFHVGVRGHWQGISKNNHTVQFSTGLKDKNDKEIYEGDKVIISVVAERAYEALVIFKKGAFRCNVYGRTLPIKSHEIEIIGHKYEN
jgi:hypothetical protein